MKQLVAATLLFSASPLLAQDATPASPVAVAAFTADMAIEAIAADPKAKAVLDAAFPGMTAHPMYEQFKSMSIKQLQPMAGDQITDAAIAKLSTGLAAIK